MLTPVLVWGQKVAHSTQWIVVNFDKDSATAAKPPDQSIAAAKPPAKSQDQRVKEAQPAQLLTAVPAHG